MYETTRSRQFAEMQQRIPEHIERLSWSREQIAEQRDNALRALLRAAIAGSPWHRARLSGVDPDTIGSADLATLPTMTKADLIENFTDIVTDRRVDTGVVERHLAGLGDDDAYLFDEYHVAVSGGSSGIRGVFVFDWESWKTYFLTMFRRIYRDAATTRPADAKPPLVVSFATKHAAHITSSLRQTFGPRDPLPVALSILDPLADNVTRLNELQPEVLLTYPSILRLLADQASSGSLRIQPAAIISVAEPLLPDIRTAAEQAFTSTPIYNWYAASEGGCVAAGCGRTPGMHLSEDVVILEAVDDQGRPVPPGIRSDKVYLTNLANHLMPIIRYELDDQVTLLPADEPCPCGSRYQRIDDVEGRRRDIFEYGDGILVHALRLYAPLTLDPEVVEFQIRQTPAGVSVLLCGQQPDLARITDRLSAELAEAGVPRPEVIVRRVAHIERLGISGKLPRFIPLATAPAPTQTA